MALKFTDTDTDIDTGNRVFLYRRGRLTTVLGAVMLLALSACGGSSGSGTASLAPNASLVAYKVLDIMPKASGALDVTTSMRYLALGAPGLADPVTEATTLFKLVANLFGATPKDPHCNYTGTMNGTSAAAPTVSGILALMLEVNPQLSWQDVGFIVPQGQQRLLFHANAFHGDRLGDGYTIKTTCIKPEGGVAGKLDFSLAVTSFSL